MIKSEIIFDVHPYYVLEFENKIKYRFGKHGVGFVDFSASDSFVRKMKGVRVYQYPAMIDKALSISPFL